MAKLPNIIEKERSTWKVISFVFKESLKGSPTNSAMMYFLTAVSGAFMFIEFGSLGLIVNEFTRHGVEGARLAVIIKAFILIVLSSLLPAIFSSLQNYYASVRGDDISRYLQKRFFLKMNELDIGTIEQPEFQNILDVSNSRGWSSVFSSISLITTSLRNILALAIAMVSLVVMSPLVLAVIVIATIPTYIFEKKNADLSAILWKQSTERRRMWGAKASPVYGKNSLVELKNFKLVEIFLKSWTDAIKGFHDESKALSKKSAKNEIWATLIQIAGYGIAFTLIIMKVYSGALLIGSLVFSFAVISRFQSALQTLFENFGKLSEHKKNLDTLMDFLEMKPLLIPGKLVIDPDAFESLEFRDVSFSYPGSEKKVIDHLSLVIMRGQNLAIVGLNGAGKTTLIRLVTRVYDPTEGEVLVNGVSLREYDLESWKKCLGILLQDYSTYSEESIAENIMLGDSDKGRDRDWLVKSAKESSADDYIQELPEKYEQRVGTEFRGGVELSKGQKQKLVLARVFYRNAPIIILDEPTAAIDALSEDTIFKSIRANHAHQTRIIISHKFSNVRDADRIILIQDGTILEEGSHDQLMKKKKGTYKGLFEMQAEGYR